MEELAALAPDVSLLDVVLELVIVEVALTAQTIDQGSQVTQDVLADVPHPKLVAELHAQADTQQV